MTNGLDYGIPIITLELTGMKATVRHALTQYQADLAEETRKALEKVCSPDNIRYTVDRAVASALNSVIEEEVDRFFRHGDGRAIVRELVEERLRNASGT